MYGSIAVPLDGSPFAEQALPLALALARRTGAALHLIHVREIEAGTALRGRGTAPDYLDRVRRRVTAHGNISPRPVALEGEASKRLVEYIEGEGIELVVIATHGWGGLARVRIGSTTDALIRELRIPIITIRPLETGQELDSGGGEEPRRIPEHEPIEHILVTLDGSPLAEAILGHAAAVGGPTVRISLVQAIPAPVPNDPASVSLALMVDQETIEANLSRALAYLDDIAANLARQVRRVDTAVLLEPRPLTAILDFADQQDVDLIAIATHGRGGLQRLALGSMADEMIRTAQQPVLVFRPGEP